MLTEFQKQKLPRLFAVHDLDGNGVITRGDFDEYTRRTARTRGWGEDAPEYQELKERFRTFWNGLEETARARRASDVRLPEWFAYWEQIFQTPGLYDQIIEPIGRDVFSMLDRDGDGSITQQEYAAIYENGGLDPADAAQAFARMDLDGDGRLSVDEIMKLLDQYFRSEDPSEPGNALFGIVTDLHAVGAGASARQ